MVKQVGRPPERDSEGNIISKSLVNVTIPTKLRDFLSKNNINRSQLFTRVVTALYMHALCITIVHNVIHLIKDQP